jgi:hypothetical protein
MSVSFSASAGRCPRGAIASEPPFGRDPMVIIFLQKMHEDASLVAPDILAQQRLHDILINDSFIVSDPFLSIHLPKAIEASSSAAPEVSARQRPYDTLAGESPIVTELLLELRLTETLKMFSSCIHTTKQRPPAARGGRAPANVATSHGPAIRTANPSRRTLGLRSVALIPRVPARSLHFQP